MPIFDLALAKCAIEMNAQYIENLLNSFSERDSPSLFITVIHPITGKISATQGFGIAPEKYRDVSKAKALETHYFKMATADIVTRPQLLKKGDTIFWGSAYLNGISVGGSGSEPYIDEHGSYVIASTIQMLCKQKFGYVSIDGHKFIT